MPEIRLVPVKPPQITLTPVGDGAAPEERGVFRRIDDAVRGAADMLTFGFADEIAARLGALTGIGGERGNYDANLEAQRARDEQGGVERFAGQLAGAVALPGAAVRSLPGAIATGAAAGGAYGFGSGEGGFEDRATSAALGAATGGAVGGALRAGANALGNRAAAKMIPTNENLRKLADQAYKKAEDAGVIFKPESVSKLTSEVVNDLAEFGFDPALQPGIAAVVQRLQGMEGQNVTLKGLDIIRRVAQSAAQAGDNPSQRALSARIIDRIDDFIDRTGADDVLMGDARRGASALKQARDLWRRLRKSEMLDTAIEKAERRAASTGSGGNLDNAIRQNVRGILDNPRKSRGLTDAERQAAERVVRGGPVQNTLRLAGKLSPQGNGLMAALGIGGTMVNPAIGGLALGGMAAKSTADRMTRKNVERLSQVIRAGGKTAKDLADLARGEMLQNAQIKRIEQYARMLGVSVPELAAAVRERMATVE